VIATNSSAASGWYNITTSTTATSVPCYFVGNRVATAAETIAQCNTITASEEMNTNIACRYGYVNDYNTTCERLVTNYPDGTDNTNSITTASGGVRECCDCKVNCAKIGTVSGGVCKDVDGWGWVRSTNWMNYWNAKTFCNNLNMPIKSLGDIENAGLWRPGAKNPFGNYWVWTTNVWGSSAQFVAFLGNNACDWVSPSATGANNSGIGGVWGWYYALCGPAL
ncbi:MAG: hypothetical protein IKD08_00480, partial [Alphaproteobacteria bacterium]|nr:hypothetical protein [Alphaproteobacteria bacterium]